jgi:hypothetical protein
MQLEPHCSMHASTPQTHASTPPKTESNGAQSPPFPIPARQPLQIASLLHCFSMPAHVPVAQLRQASEIPGLVPPEPAAPPDATGAPPVPAAPPEAGWPPDAFDAPPDAFW